VITPELLAQVRRLTIRSRRAVEEVFSGAYRSAFRGQGLEFAEVREYVPGDDIRSIDWNVTARAGRPFVKRFEEERELTVVVALDLSGSLSFGSRARAKRDAAAEAGALLALAAARSRDRVGLLLFTDRVELFLSPGKSRSRALRIARELLAFEPEGRGTDLAGALEFLHRVLRRRAVVFLLSDWRAPSFDRPLSLLARKHDVVALDVADPLERETPTRGLLRVRDLETGKAAWVDASSRAARGAWRAAVARRAKELDQTFRRAGVPRLSLDADRAVAPVLIRFFERRAAAR
jgi:uncharacterized protein (DUF58 family)